MRMRRQVQKIGFLLITIVCLTLVYNEYLIYWQVLSECNWPIRDENSKNSVKFMILSDTHLLGSRLGHWFDKLRREWQQYRAFQTARYLLKPDYVVILGDVTDEGKWCSDKEWTYYENRVKELFFMNEEENSKLKGLILVVGNHDIGFHYDMIERKIERFDRSFHTRYLTLDAVDKRDIYFITVNSMAMENDGCRFCSEAQRELKKMNRTLECLKNRKQDSKTCLEKLGENRVYSRPIVFTHFPLFRQSDSICPLDFDSEFNTLGKNPGFKPKFDCLSLESTKQLIEMLNPRIVFNGHTHYSCYNELHGVPEYTLASFSWRNINTPSMLLVQVDDKNHFVSKCFLPSESNVFTIYTFVAVCILAYLSLFIYFKYFNKYILTLVGVVQRTKIN